MAFDPNKRYSDPLCPAGGPYVAVVSWIGYTQDGGRVIFKLKLTAPAEVRQYEGIVCSFPVDPQGSAARFLADFCRAVNVLKIFDPSDEAQVRRLFLGRVACFTVQHKVDKTGTERANPQRWIALDDAGRKAHEAVAAKLVDFDRQQQQGSGEPGDGFPPNTPMVGPDEDVPF